MRQFYYYAYTLLLLKKSCYPPASHSNSNQPHMGPRTIGAGVARSSFVSCFTGTIFASATCGTSTFGTFKSVNRAARTGKNPKTGAALKIAATTVPKFSAGAGFKLAVSGKKAKK